MNNGMSVDELVALIPGTQAVIDRLASWPSFHDAEIVSIRLDREQESHLVVHVFNTTSALTSKGTYVTERHSFVKFRLRDVSDIELAEFNHQNVVSGIHIERQAGGFKVILGPSYGVNGYVVARELRFSIEPGLPPESVYAEDRAE